MSLFSVVLLHGDMDQFERNKVINAFKKQEIPILVATDVTGKKQSCEKKNCFSAEWLKGRSQLAHMRNRYHFIANFHITERKYILFLTRYDKNNIIG